MTQPVEYHRGTTTEAVGRVEIAISNVLRTGVITSLAIILLGMLISYLHHPAEARDPKQLGTLTAITAQYPHSLHDVLAGVLSLRGQAITVLGLLILIATPVLRVAISILAFAVQHDRAYVLITCIVLSILILSFVLGHVEG